MLTIYNTLRRQKEAFKSIVPGRVGMYVCGMTVYDYCHIGHARVMVVFDAVQRWLLEARPDCAALLTEPPTGAAFTPPADAAGKPPAVKVTNLTWRYKPGQPAQLDNLSFEVPRGARCLLVGANGAGKTTLLRLLGGKSMVPVDSVQCLGIMDTTDDL
jgi:ABC-type multidrug transport system fused ATPase/permease subunit